MIEINQLPEQELLTKGVRTWPVWKKEVSRFSWTYEEEEWCYFLEGEVLIETDTGNYEIRPGDFVVFPKGLKCVWDIRKPVRKHYNFL
ncbi:MAG: cupin domain-containing protein [Bacteroidales bacterium]|nr:cupin domain-containing protein [Bacteroidales bacterium]